MDNTKPQKIINRLVKCNCGCGGKDSQHARYFQRVVADVVIFDDVQYVRTSRHSFGRIEAVAQGTVHLNGQARIVYFCIGSIDEPAHRMHGTVYTLGWTLTD